MVLLYCPNVSVVLGHVIAQWRLPCAVHGHARETPFERLSYDDVPAPPHFTNLEQGWRMGWHNASVQRWARSRH